MEADESSVSFLRELVADLRKQRNKLADIQTAALAEIQGERDKLAAFKEYVHKLLDDAGVPADPDSPHKAEGCRIGGRLDLVLAQWKP